MKRHRWLFLLLIVPCAAFYFGQHRPVSAKALDTEQDHQRSIRYAEAAVEALQSGKPLKDIMQPSDYDQLVHDLQQGNPKYLEQQVLEEDSELASVVDLQRRVVKTREEQANLESILANPDVLNHVQINLRLTPGQVHEPENVMLRLLSVDVLKSALEWQENPLFKNVELRVTQLILEQAIFDKNFEEELRRSAYVDRLELFSSLIKVNPALARKLVNEIKPSVYRQHLLDLLNETGSPS